MAGPADEVPRDYKDEDITQALVDARKLAKTNLRQAVEGLHDWEKKTRMSSDVSSTRAILIAIVTMCNDAGDWNLLNENVKQLAKKRDQIQGPIKALVEQVIEFIPSVPTEEAQLSVIEMLRTVTFGKIFLEIERATVTMKLCDIYMNKNQIKEAVDVLCTLPVETFGSMPRLEKTRIILRQISLTIDHKQWGQAVVMSRKINTRFFRKASILAIAEDAAAKALEEKKNKTKTKAKPAQTEEVTVEDPEEIAQLKVQFYKLQILIAKHDGRYLDACNYYRQILDTEFIQKNPEESLAALRRTIYFVILAPYDNEQSDLVHRILSERQNSQLPIDYELLELFTKPELMRWPTIQSRFGAHLTSTDVFSTSEDADDEKEYGRWKDLRKRVIEHNVRMISKCYSRIKIGRLCELLDLKEEGPAETERFISNLVTNKTIYARIDRPAEIVNFAKSRDVDDLLNEWGSDVKSLLTLLERVDHLITKEEMMGSIQSKEQAGGQDL